MALLDRHPDALVAHHEPAEILTELGRADSLSLAQARRLDAYLLHWSNLILHRPADREGVQELLSLCELARDQLASSGASRALIDRWSAFEDLLDLRRRILLRQAGSEQSRLARQDEILELIHSADRGRIQQSELARKLDLSPGRVSQILGILEERGLVTRQREGRKCWLSVANLTSAGENPNNPTSNHHPERLGARIFGSHAA